MKKKYILLIVSAFILIFLDQLLKFWVKTHMFLGEEINIFGNWFKLYFIENEGMAFGMAFGGNLGKYLLTIFRMVAAIFIAWVCVKMVQKNTPARLLACAVLVFTGAIGNVIDCIFYGKIFSVSEYYGSVAQWGGQYAPWLQGKVVDMLRFDLFTIHFPSWFPFCGGQYMSFFPAIFNLADTWVTIGLFATILFCYKPLSQFIASFETKK